MPSTREIVQLIEEGVGAMSKRTDTIRTSCRTAPREVVG